MKTKDNLYSEGFFKILYNQLVTKNVRSIDKVILKTSAEKDLRKLPTNIIDRVWSQLETLATNPLPRQSLKLSKTERLYRVKIGHYRIVYEVNTQLRQLLVHYVRHRSESYRDL